MTKEQSLSILLLMASFMAYITPNETTRKFDKLRKHTRKGINDLHKANTVKFKELAISSNDTWERARVELDNIDYTISVSLSIMTLYGFLEGSPWRNMFFTDKTLREAIASLMHEHRKPREGDAEQVHTDSVKLSEMFAKILGITESTKLSFIKLKAKNKEILGMKIV